MKIGPCFSLFLSIFLLSYFLIPTPSQGDPPKPGKEVYYSDCLLASEPQIEVTPNGIVKVSVKTIKLCSGARVFLGLIPQAAELHYPVYRVRGRAVQQDAQTFLCKFSIRKMEETELDINNLWERRGGRLAFRLSIFGDNLNVYDRLFAYGRSSGGRYFRAPALIEGPFVDCLCDTSAVISWEFDRPAPCRLEIASAGYRREFSEPQWRFEAPVSGLSPLTDYFYSITWVDHDISFSTPPLEFRTAPVKGSDRPFSFAVMSDCRGAAGHGDRYVEGHNQRVLQALMSHAYSQRVSLILFPGDLVSGHVSDPKELEDQLRAWKRTTTPVGGRIPIFEGMGNHDIVGRYFEGSKSKDYAPRHGQEASEVLFGKHFVNPTNGPDPARPDFPPYRENVYSFDWGNAHFTMLNSNYLQKGPGEAVADMDGELEGTLREEQLEWLDADLRAAREAGQKHLFVFVHEPAFPCGGHVADAMWWDGKRPEMIQMRDRFWRILCRHRVLAIFAGDEHNYSRALIDRSVHPSFDVPIWQIITGGAGAPYYAQDVNVPWIEAVRAFYPLEHFCVVNVNGDGVTLTVLTSEGLLVEKVDLY